MRRIHVALIMVAIALVLSSGDLRAQKPANGRILMVTQSAGFRHGSVNRGDKPLSPAERVMTELGVSSNLFRVDCTQDVAADFTREKLEKRLPVPSNLSSVRDPTPCFLASFV